MMSEPIIGTKYDLDKETGKYYVQATISGFDTEEQAAIALEFVEKAICGERIEVQ